MLLKGTLLSFNQIDLMIQIRIKIKKRKRNIGEWNVTFVYCSHQSCLSPHTPVTFELLLSFLSPKKYSKLNVSSSNPIPYPSITFPSFTYLYCNWQHITPLVQIITTIYCLQHKMLYTSPHPEIFLLHSIHTQSIHLYIAYAATSVWDTALFKLNFL